MLTREFPLDTFRTLCKASRSRKITVLLRARFAPTDLAIRATALLWVRAWFAVIMRNEIRSRQTVRRCLEEHREIVAASGASDDEVARLTGSDVKMVKLLEAELRSAPR